MNKRRRFKLKRRRLIQRYRYMCGWDNYASRRLARLRLERMGEW